MGLDMVLYATMYEAPSTVLGAFPGLNGVVLCETVTVKLGTWRDADEIHEQLYQLWRENYVNDDEDGDGGDAEFGKLEFEDAEVFQELLDKIQSESQNATTILPLQNAVSASLKGWQFTYEWCR